MKRVRLRIFHQPDKGVDYPPDAAAKGHTTQSALGDGLRVSGRLYEGRWFRILTIIDRFTRECLLLLADSSLTGQKVALALSRVIAEREAPESIMVDNGTEFASKAMGYVAGASLAAGVLIGVWSMHVLDTWTGSAAGEAQSTPGVRAVAVPARPVSRVGPAETTPGASQKTDFPRRNQAQKAKHPAISAMAAPM